MLEDERENARLRLKLVAGDTKKEYIIPKGRDQTIRQILKERMWASTLRTPSNANRYFSPCNQTKQVTIELYKDKHMDKVLKFFRKKEQVPVMSTKIVLEDDKLYTEETYPSECVYWQTNKWLI